MAKLAPAGAVTVTVEGLVPMATALFITISVPLSFPLNVAGLSFITLTLYPVPDGKPAGIVAVIGETVVPLLIMVAPVVTAENAPVASEI
jgi:hypothetical protein